VDKIHHGQDAEISLVQIANILLRHWRIVLSILFVSLSISVIQALRKPTNYTSSSSFFPEGSSTSLSGATAIAQQFGIAIPGNTNERTPQFYQNLILSTALLQSIVTQRFTVIRDLTEAEEANLITYYEVPAATEEEGIQRAIESLRGGIRVGTSIETGIVSFSVTTSDPGLSEQVATSILEGIHNFDRISRQSQASAERRFAEERLSELQGELKEAEDSLKTFLTENRLFTNSPQLQFEHDRLERSLQMRQELVTSLAQSFESARIEEVRSTPLITILEYPQVPALRDPKGRLRMLILGGVIGLILGSLAAILNHYRLAALERQDPELDEFSFLWSSMIRGITRFGRYRSERSS